MIDYKQTETMFLFSLFILDDAESVPVTPLFATQPIVNERENVASPSDRGKTLLIFTCEPI